MGELESALEVLEAEDLASLPDAALEEDFARLQRAAERLEVQRLRRLAMIDRRQPYLRDGCLSTSSWFARTHRVAHSTASGDVRMARALEAMPDTIDALTSGAISESAARLLVFAREADPKAFAESESVLVDAATSHEVRDLGRVVAHWRNAAESKHVVTEGEEALRRRRNLHASRTVFGMVRIDGDLDPELGETVLTALQSQVDADLRTRDPDDRRSPAQRRADALGEICRQWLDSSDRSEVGGELPHMTVTMSLEALKEASEACEFDHVGPVHAEIGRRLACDATICRVVVGSRSEPLDVGRLTSVVPAPMRRALRLRDRHCRFPGCDRPPPWCDAHHVVHWADGGRTALENLVLLCRRHHGLVHGGFQVEMVAGRPVFRRKDGTVLEDRAPP